MATPEVRRLTAADLPALVPEVDRARGAGEFAASSDDVAESFLNSVSRTRERWARPTAGPSVTGDES